MEFFIALGMIPWICAGFVLLGLLCYTTENDSPVFSTIVVGAVLIALQMFSTFQPFTLLCANPGLAALCVIAYIVAGVLTGVLKWTSFAYNIADAWSLARAKSLAFFLSQFRVKTEAELTEDQRRDMLRRARNNMGGYNNIELPLVVSQHKSRITTWMIYWPATLFWLVLNDPIRRVYSFIYYRCAGILTTISNRAMAKFKSDFN